MNLSRKTLYYSITLGVIIVTSMFLYLIFLLPNLYVDNMKKNDFKKAQVFIESAIENKEIDNSKAPSLTTSYIVKIPKEGNIININSPSFKLQIEAKNKELIELINLVREIDFTNSNLDTSEKFKQLEKYNIGDTLVKLITSNNENFNFKAEINKNVVLNDNPKDASYYKGKNYIMISSSIKEKERIYSSYMGLGKKDGETILTMVPLATSDISDVREVALYSLPMILVYLFLITVLASLFFSKKIVNPIKTLDDYTSNLSNLNYEKAKELDINTGDEIEALSIKVSQMYDELRNSYKKLEEEYKNKELFLRASSHQLKTPI